jgi:pyruvate dehydrogenase E1 component beta subunit
MCSLAAGVIAQLAQEGIDIEFIDPRTIKPLDMETIGESIRKTHRAVVVNEGPRTGGFTSEVSARIMDECFDDLDAPVMRVTADDVPIPFSPSLELEVIPAEKDILAAVRAVMR